MADASNSLRSRFGTEYDLLERFIAEGLRIFQVIQAIERFREVLHYRVYSICQFKREKKMITDFLHENFALVDSGFPTVVHESAVFSATDYIRNLEEKMDKAAEHLKACGDIGLGDYIHLEEKAVELDIRIAVVASECETEIIESRWDIVLEKVCEALRMSLDRNQIFPLWRVLEYKRGHLSFSFPLEYPLFVGKDPTNVDLLDYLLAIHNFCNTEHVQYLCDKYEFYCQFLDDELRNVCYLMSRQIAEPVVKNIASVYSLSDEELCDQLVMTLFCSNDGINYGNVWRISANQIRTRFCLKFYRSCLKQGNIDLADEWMKFRLRFGIDYGFREVEVCCSLLERTADFLRRGRVVELRKKLNGCHTGVSGHYRLPVRKSSQRKLSKKPWWLTQLKASSFSCQSSIRPGSSPRSWDSSATTVRPLDAGNTFSPEQLAETIKKERLETIAQAAEFYRDHSRLSDEDMCKTAFCTMTPNFDEGTRLILKWDHGHDQEQQRATNLQTSKAYHCRSFSYDALRNEWSGTDGFCAVGYPLNVDEKGALRDVLDCLDCRFHESVFKMYRHPADHRIDNYLAAVRAQAVAAYYADRFRELTNDKFGRLRILKAELYLLYEDKERKRIVDFVAREERLGHLLQRPEPSSDFRKYTNNWTWKNRRMTVDIFEAFSHFSYHESEGVLMITDLQGFTKIPFGERACHLLTDPVVHCQTRRTLLFGKTNYGSEGMSQFFSKVHRECNHICVDLKLKRPEETAGTSTFDGVKSESGGIGERRAGLSPKKRQAMPIQTEISVKCLKEDEKL